MTTHERSYIHVLVAEIIV